MENSNDYKFINGTFTSEEAEILLNTLLNYKIDYHSKEDFSNHIRFNQNKDHSKLRIQELFATKEEIRQLIASCKLDNRNLIINSTISIRLED